MTAVRGRNKGTPDQLLRDEFYRVQKDVVFLYHLHKQVNLQALRGRGGTTPESHSPCRETTQSHPPHLGD